MSFPPPSDEAEQHITQWLADFTSALERRDLDAGMALFAAESYWRDLLAFTWTLHTAEGQAAIRAMLAATLHQAAPGAWTSEGVATESNGVIEGRFTFETAQARGRGVLRLKDGKAWTLLTALHELKGHEEQQGPTRESGTIHGVVPGRRSWRETRAAQRAELGYERQPYCLIVGGGQGGIALAARLKRLGVETLIVEALPRAGDSWRRRYNSLCLHDPVWYDHLPYLPFPDHWPVYTPKDKLADWLEAYVSIMELDYWGGATVTGARFVEDKGTWDVTLERGGQTLTLHPTQLVMATGMSGRPKLPDLPGRDLFKGQQHHSSQHRGGAGWGGKRCVIVGANNSAHDIGADLFEQGASVTIIQRSSTLVARSESMGKLGMRKLFTEEAVQQGITTELADLLFAATPYRVMAEQQASLYRKLEAYDADLYGRLRAAGFKLDFGEDGSGLYMKYLRRGSGYYIDVGASELIADGRIALCSDVEPVAVTEKGLRLSDGRDLPADLIVWATGYEPMEGWVAELISPAVAERVGRCWGLGSGTLYDPGPWEGELRNMWKPTAQDNLWFQGGNLQQARHYSLYLALQLKARAMGWPTPVYSAE